MPGPGVSGLSAGTSQTVAPVCQNCVWWQSRGNRTASKQRWIERAEEDWGEWGSIYLDDHGLLLGSLQYGPSHLFPRAADLPGGPASDDAALVIINREPTDCDAFADLVVRGDIGEALAPFIRH